MQVQCVINNFLQITNLSTLQRLKKYFHLPDGQTNLKLGQEYCVYGLVFRDNAPWFLLCLDEDDDPSPYPAELFRVVDGRLSSSWRLAQFNELDGAVTTFMVFEEWSSDHYFYERLVDGDPEAIRLFKKYRELMDSE